MDGWLGGCLGRWVGRWMGGRTNELMNFSVEICIGFMCYRNIPSIIKITKATFMFEVMCCFYILQLLS